MTNAAELIGLVALLLLFAIVIEIFALFALMVASYIIDRKED